VLLWEGERKQVVNKVVKEFGKVKHKIQLFKNLVVRIGLENKGKQEIKCNVSCFEKYCRESLWNEEILP
jgi:myo-inositol catabolism protein IolC